MPEASRVIDCERHALVGSLETLSQYMDEAMALRVAESEFVLPAMTPHPGVQIEGAPVDQSQWDPSAVAASTPAEVERVILLPSQSMTTSGWLDHELATTFVSSVNDHLTQAWLPEDARFRVAIGLAPHDSQLAADEVRRHADDPTVVAACMPLMAVNMGQRHYYPIYEALGEHELPLIVHPAGSEGGVIGPAALGGAGPRTVEETFSLLPQVAAVNMASLVFDGIFDLYPSLKVVFAGFGFEWAPSYIWRMAQEWRGLRVAVPWVTRSPEEIVADHIRFVVDGAAATRSPAAWSLAGMLDGRSLLYGSDAPFAAEPAEAVLARAPEGMREPVARDNAMAVFGARIA